MNKDEERLKRLRIQLKRVYPDADCALVHESAFELLIATILSAQCTDERVNKVTPALFRRFPTPRVLSEAPRVEVESLIRSTGFFRSKALSLVEASRRIVQDFGGEVPRTMEGLLSLRGVARKTANVVLGVCFGVAEGVVVDTHVKRLACRMGFTEQRDPGKVEKDLMRLVPRKDWIWLSHALIAHGRGVCKALSPLCPRCPVNDLCPKNGVSRE